MNVTRNNIIIATEKVIDLDDDQKRKLILTLLGTNPTVVLRALEIGVPVKLFKVVITRRGPDKINVIKAFREIAGAGLADAKEWSEGKTYKWGDKELPSGVFGHGLTLEAANALLEKVNRSLGTFNAGVKAEIVDNDATVNPLPAVWNV